MSTEPARLRAMERLVLAVQELSLARELDAVMRIVRRVARELSGADGATFVLREGDKCFYADEDAIAPLWKGNRFPMEACISGWVMRHREAVTIPDIYTDPRVPTEVYRPTFVKSLAMVPIRARDPVGAIGTYWSSSRRVEEGELKLLQALADSTSIAIENVQLFSELESRVRVRTAQLEAANRELETFSYTASHDLRAPLRRIEGYARALEEDLGSRLDADSKLHLDRIRASGARMGALIDDLLRLAHVTRRELRDDAVDITAIARAVCDELVRGAPDRPFEIAIEDGVNARGDESLIRAVLENLIGNAFKFTARAELSRIEIGSAVRDGQRAFFVRDNGAGFDMSHADRLFLPFQRLHAQDEFTGSGVGLATVQRIVHRHGGRIWAESKPGEGATFWFTLAP